MKIHAVWMAMALIGAAATAGEFAKQPVGPAGGWANTIAGAALEAAVLDQHSGRNLDTQLHHGAGLLELAVFKRGAARGAGDDDVVLADGEVVVDRAADRIGLVHLDLFLLVRDAVLGDRDQTRLGVELLHDVEHVAGQNPVAAFEVVDRFGQVHHAALLLVGDGLRSHILAVETLHRVRHT